MTNVYKNITQKQNKYYCNYCKLNACKKSQYDKHILTAKHKRLSNVDADIYNNCPNLTLKYKCKCGKCYKYRQSLYVHKKKCDFKECIECDNKIIVNNDSTELKTMLLQVMKENKDLQKTILNLVPQIGNNNNNINTTNNVKQKFNINVFLNEKCKDAISIDEFIDTIEVSMKNLLTTRDKGLGEGLSSIIIDNMNKLSVYERPMHCTDKKRETMYIKNQEWGKDEKQEQIDNLLKKVENKQLKNIEKWTDENPNFMESEKLQEEYMRLIKGCTSSIDECRGKAIKKVCDNVHIEKES